MSIKAQLARIEAAIAARDAGTVSIEDRAVLAVEALSWSIGAYDAVMPSPLDPDRRRAIVEACERAEADGPEAAIRWADETKTEICREINRATGKSVMEALIPDPDELAAFKAALQARAAEANP